MRIRKNIDKATADAEVTRTKAQASADAKLIAAQAEAAANEEIAKSLTDELLKWTLYEKWNGELPVVSGSSANVMNIDSILGGSEDN